MNLTWPEISTFAFCLFSIVGVYVTLTNKITRLEVKIEEHTKRHEAWEDTTRRIYDKLDELKTLIIDNNNNTHKK